VTTQIPGVGALLGGDFRIERQLGAGGMGAVYVAEQQSTGRKRALKLMHPSLVSDTKLRERFEQEARVGAKIPSDHVVQVIAAGVDEASGAPFIAMELLEGEDLAATLARQGTLTPEEVGAILEPVCHALGAAHEAAIVHRDLKPENIFLSRAQGAGRSYDVKLLDFGIAKLTAEARTMATSAVGTPLWMAPEQTDPRAKIMPSADVWSLGLLAFAMLTGRSYWRVASEEGVGVQALLREVLFEPLAPASVRAVELGVKVPLPAELDGWFSRCVDRNPAARFPTAKEAWMALVPVLGSKRAPPAELAALATIGQGGGKVEDLGLAATAAVSGDLGMAATMPAPEASRAPVGDSSEVTVGRTAPSAEGKGKSRLRAAPLWIGAIALVGVTLLVIDNMPPKPESSEEQAEARAKARLVMEEMEAKRHEENEHGASTPQVTSPKTVPEITAAPSTSVAPPPPPPPKPPPPKAPPRPFDAAGAQHSLNQVARTAKHICGRMHGPRAFALTVKFGADGKAVSASADPSLQEPGTVLCAKGLVLGARTKPYDPVGGVLGMAAVGIALD